MTELWTLENEIYDSGVDILCGVICDLILQKLTQSRRKAIDALAGFRVGFKDLYPLSFKKCAPLRRDLWVSEVSSVEDNKSRLS